MLLIFISSTLEIVSGEKKKRPFKARVEFFHTVFINPDIYSFNLIRNLGDWVKPSDLKAKGQKRIIAIQYGGQGWKRPAVVLILTSVLGKTEYICQNDVGEGTAEVHAEVIDQSIRVSVRPAPS